MIDTLFMVYLALLVLMMALAVRADFRRRARLRRESDLRAATGRDPAG